MNRILYCITYHNNNNNNNNNRLSVTSDYDCILVMLPGSSKNGRLEVTQFSVPTTEEKLVSRKAQMLALVFG